MVKYQLSYGGSSSSGGEKEVKGDKEDKTDKREVKQGAAAASKAAPPQWFELDDSKNTHVYVSNLPLDIDEAEFVEFMGKCGLVMKDEKGNWKVKLYRSEGGGLKGDGVCTYIKVDSVTLALQILDQSYFKSNIVTVERAKFSMKGEYDPTKKPKQKKRKEKMKLKKQQESLFSWKPEKMRGERGKNEKVVVVKHAFHPDEFEAEVELILELKEDFKGEAGKFGECRKVDLFDNNTEGALKIHMSTPEEAEAVVTNFNGRFFAGRQLEAYIWDGFEKLNVVETEAERAKRLERWEKYVEDDEGEAKKPKVDEDATPPRGSGSGGGDVESDDERAFDD